MKKTLALFLALILCMSSLTALADVPELLGPEKVVIKSVYQNAAFDPNTDLNAKTVEEVTGYKAEYFMLPAQNADEKLAMEVAGGFDYDIIRCSVNQFNMLKSAGALLPLNELLETYGKELLAGCTQETWDACSDENGVIYGIPGKYAADLEVASFLCCRWDLMKAAGIEKLPETLDEFYNTLVALKNFYGDEYIIFTGPFLPTTEKNENWLFPKVIASAYGIWNEWMVNEDGKVIYMTEHPNFEAMMAYLTKLYDEGLIDPDWAVNTNDSVNEKFTSGKAIITCSARSGCNITSPAIISNLGITYDDLAYIRPLKGEDGTCTYMVTEAISSVSVIPKSCKEAADVIHWCNEKVKNQLYLVFGVEGTHFTYEENGVMAPINPIFSEERGNAYWYMNGMDAVGYQKDWPSRIRKSEGQYHAWANVTMKAQNETPEIFVDNPFKFMPAYDNFSKYNSSLHTLLSDFAVQVITGAKDFSALSSLQKDWAANNGEEVRAELQAYVDAK